MSLSRFFLNLVAFPLQLGRLHRPQTSPASPRILVIRRNRLGDMIYTLPLLHALRRRYPQAHIAVACDPVAASIAQACAAVNHVIVLKPGWNPWQATVKNAAHLQDFDWVIAAKGGYDRRLAVLTRLTNGAIRIGFENASSSTCYTHPVPLLENPYEVHQIETLLHLLQPLGQPGVEEPIDLGLRIPAENREFAATLLTQPPFSSSKRFMLINLSSTVPLKFREDDFTTLATRILDSTDLVIGLVATPADQPRASALAARIASSRVIAVATPGPLDLTALLERATCLLTPEGGAAHLASTVNTPALVLWSEGPFKKWYSRGPRHAFVHAETGEQLIPLERVWQALQPFLK